METPLEQVFLPFISLQWTVASVSSIAKLGKRQLSAYLRQLGCLLLSCFRGNLVTQLPG